MFKVKSLLSSGTSVADATLNELEIKLYRQSCLLRRSRVRESHRFIEFLIARTEYTRFEYIERLANIYHIMNELTRISVIGHRLVSSRTDCLPAGLEKKLVRRLLRVKQQLSDQENNLRFRKVL